MKVGAEALPWLQDPYNVEEEPLRQFMLHALPSQLEREVQAFVLMACLAVLLVYVPVRLATALAPSLFPLDMRLLGGSLTEAPLDLLLVQVCLPLTAPLFRPRCAAHLPLQGLPLFPSFRQHSKLIEAWPCQSPDSQTT